jgi:hypothetical protein
LPLGRVRISASILDNYLSWMSPIFASICLSISHGTR